MSEQEVSRVGRLEISYPEPESVEAGSDEIVYVFQLADEGRRRRSSSA